MSFTMEISSCQAVDDLTGTVDSEEIMFFGRTFETIDANWMCSYQLSLPLFFANETQTERLFS